MPKFRSNQQPCILKVDTLVNFLKVQSAIQAASGSPHVVFLALISQDFFSKF